MSFPTNRAHASGLARCGILFLAILAAAGCSTDTGDADLLLLNGRVYTFTWDDPAVDGTPAANAPYDDDGWHPDAEAVAVRDGIIVFVGSDDEAEAYRGSQTEVIDVGGATILPGFVDSHTHIAGLGANLERVNLVDVTTEAEMVKRVVARVAEVEPGAWIIGWGWDEGAWADRYPDNQRLSEAVPDNPVVLRGLHGFAALLNRSALEQAGITGTTESPVGGEIRLDWNGQPTGILVNNATDLLTGVLPQLTQEQLEERVLVGLEEMAASGDVAIHEAGAGVDLMGAFESMERGGRLPIRVYAMLRGSEEPLLREWLERGPDTESQGMLITRSVKAFYDGALGSRGAKLLEEYSDMPGHKGVSGDDYGFDEEIIAEMMAAGFQVCTHAIGDAGNRETLDFIERVFSQHPDARNSRHRIEHAQVVHPDDFERFADLDLIASMEPPHAVEDKTWAEDRLGPDRVKGAYAWRTMRRQGVPLTFNADLAGSDHDIFYGLHAAITRRDKEIEPPGGWYPEQNMTAEEAVRGYSVWSAYSAFLEDHTGVLEPGRWADITVIDIDPLVVGSTEPERLFDGSVKYTVVGGELAYRSGSR